MRKTIAVHFSTQSTPQRPPTANSRKCWASVAARKKMRMRAKTMAARKSRILAILVMKSRRILSSTNRSIGSKS